jgi:hypothetical protein
MIAALQQRTWSLAQDTRGPRRRLQRLAREEIAGEALIV